MSVTLKKTYVGFGFEVILHNSGIVEVVMLNSTFDRNGFESFVKDLLEVRNILSNVDPEYIIQAKALLLHKRKLAAVKLIKEKTGKDLKACKEIADKMEQDIAEELHKVPDHQID